jgi:alginate O-acetyltransferase complex protein AlgJ
MAAAFLAVLVAEPVHQAFREVTDEAPKKKAPPPASLSADEAAQAAAASEGPRWRFLRVFTRKPTVTNLRVFEGEMLGDSLLAAEIRKRYQAFLTGVFGHGTPGVVIGRGGMAYYFPDVQSVVVPEHVSDVCRFRKEFQRERCEPFFHRVARWLRGGPPFEPDAPLEELDPLNAIVDFRGQLALRGIKLLVVPVPLKQVIHPEGLWTGYPAEAGPAWSPDYRRWCRRLDAAGVEWLDLTDTFWKAKAGGDVFLPLDTHWSPYGMRVAAEAIASRVRPWLEERPDRLRGRYRAMEYVIPGESYGYDLAQLLGVDAKLAGRIPERLTPRAALTEPDGRPAWAGDEAEVLLIGDSFSATYCDEANRVGPASASGLAQQLMLELQAPVRLVPRSGGGATAVRRVLTEHPELLANKRIVIWEFTARDLFGCRVAWTPIPLRPVPGAGGAPGVTVTPGAGTDAEPCDEGTVVVGELMTAPPTIRTSVVPYADALATYKFRVERVESGRYAAPHLLGVVPVMKDRALLPADAWVVGRKYRLTLSPRLPHEVAPWFKFDDSRDFDLPQLWIRDGREAR